MFFINPKGVLCEEIIPPATGVFSRLLLPQVKMNVEPHFDGLNVAGKIINETDFSWWSDPRPFNFCPKPFDPFQHY